MPETETFPDPQFITVMADQDGHARWVGAINATEVMQANRYGVYILVLLDAEGRVCIGFKPGGHWESAWSPPIKLERR
jgi:hypothetical protein